MSTETFAACACIFGAVLVVIGIAVANLDERVSIINILIGCAVMWASVVLLLR